MAYSELIKKLDTIRTYIRGFYIYGFLSRDDFSQKSSRTYDDEKRRVSNYLGDYMSFRSEEGGKVSFLSIDTKNTPANPFFYVFKAKSFTAMDISLHFMILDILHGFDKDGKTVSKTLSQILDEIAEVYLKDFSSDFLPEESSLRKKLKEYCELGLLKSKKLGKVSYYSVCEIFDYSFLSDALTFFSESMPCGVLGNFILDKMPVEERNKSQLFYFKHHYLNQSIESDLLCIVFKAIREKRSVNLIYQKKYTKDLLKKEVVPLVIYQSVQDGRMYIMNYDIRSRVFSAMRFDYIFDIELANPYPSYDLRRNDFEEVRKYIWGVALRPKLKNEDKTCHVSFCLHFDEGESFIFNRLLREKRNGRVEKIDANTARFETDIFDPMEIIPWIRTFICRITEFNCSDRRITELFYDDIKKMGDMYEVQCESSANENIKVQEGE